MELSNCVTFLSEKGLQVIPQHQVTGENSGFKEEDNSIHILAKKYEVNRILDLIEELPLKEREITTISIYLREGEKYINPEIFPYSVIIYFTGM